MASAAPAVAPRLHWIDWLRVGAVAGVFVFHTLRPFDSTDWHVKNAETNALLGMSQILFSTFGLAVLFLLAGAGARFALRKRSSSTFLRERTSRLLVPFVIGTLVLSPVQAFIEAAHRGTATGPLPDWVGWWSFAIGWVGRAGPSPEVFGIGYHLWFLGFLFAISAAALPICRALLGRRGTAATGALADRVAAWPGSTLAFAVPVAVLIIAFAPLGADEHDWAEFGWYLAYFLIGFVLVGDSRFLAAVRRDLRVALVLAVASTAALIGLDFVEWMTNSESRADAGRALLLVSIWAIEGWAWTLVVLNLGLRAGAVQHAVGARIGDAVLPVYVVHQPVILVVAFFVVQWPAGIAAKAVAVFGISAAITLVLVELALRTRVTRMLLGARAPSDSTVAPPPHPVVEPQAGQRAAGSGRGAHHARPR